MARIDGRAFPNRDDGEARGNKCVPHLEVTLDVPLELRAPEFDIRTRRAGFRTVRVSMPKAPVHEHGDAPRSIGEVGPPGEVAVT
jgi:hypothetical protein